MTAVESDADLHADLHADATAALTRWTPPNRAQDALRHAYLAFLAARTDATARSCEPGHLTASAVVLSADHAGVLLTLHPRVGRWLQLGGHCEPGDRTLSGVGLREATEESGIAGLRIDPHPVHLDAHPITCSLGVPTRHLDVCYLVTAPPGAVPVISHESDDLRFWPVDALPADADDSVREAVRLALSAVRTAATSGPDTAASA